jgi:tRNA A-37 threonylcarbamoyl transferase component Bud32
MPSAPTTSAELIDLVRKSGVVPPEKLGGLSDLSLPDDPQTAGAALVAQGFMTRFQIQQLLAGRHKGFRVGAYLIQDMLGRGGMGAVYLAEHVELHRKVAVKVLVPGRDEDQRLALERFTREARAAAALDHPNIVRIFDVSRHNDVPYLVMEFVEGETLQQVLDRDGAIPYPTAAEYIAQAAAGLQHAHEKGFIHRDIKPGNLMREKSGTVKILDMGLARSASSADKLTELLDNGAVVGTADFIAPEQALNQPNVDGRADIYSLGATFFALIIGKPPFEGNTTQKLLQHQLRSAPRLESLDATLPKGLSAVVAKMLAKKPDDRYQSPAEVIAALAPWMGNSARILAGLSRTNLAQGADLQATLSEVGRGGSSRRLGGGTAVAEEPEYTEVEQSQAGKRTGSVAAAITTRERGPRRKAAAQPNRNKVLLYAGIGVAVTALGIFGAWYGLRGKKPPESAGTDNRAPDTPPVTPKTDPKVDPKGNPKVDPKVNPKVNPKVEPGMESLAYKFDPAEIAPFRMRLNGGTVLDGKKGTLPHGIATYALKDGEAEFEAGKVDNTPALSITRLSAAGDTHVAFELEREVGAQGMGLKLKDNTEYKVRLRYRANGATQLAVAVHTIVGYKTAGYNQFPAMADRWATKEVTFTRKEAPLRLTIAVLGSGAQVAIASVEIFEIVPPANGEKSLSRLELDGQKPFVIRSGLTADASDPNQRHYKQISRTGVGEPPAGWTARVWNKDTEMEFLAEEAGGKPALCIRNVRGPGSAMLFMPHFDCPTSACRLRFEYSAGVQNGRFVVRFKPADNRGAWDVVKPPVTGGAWRAEELDVDLKGAVGGVFEFHNSDPSPNAALRLRSAAVTELRGSAGTGDILFTLDATDLPVFKNTKRGRAITAGDPDPRVPGVYFGGWKNETVSVWSCGPVAGSKALAYANANGVQSAQIGIDLEGGTGGGLKFEPGQRLRLRVEYRTAGRGIGRAYFQNHEDWKVPDDAALPNSNGAWNTVDVVTTRGDKPLRCLVDADESGTENVLFIRSVKVLDAGRGPPPASTPATSPTPPAAPDLSKWAEGSVVYALDVAKVPEFRVVKERFTRTSGEAEKLPTGIGCHAWKENAVGEFRREKPDGVPALGVTNLNDEKSGQFFFQLEGDMKLPLQPGKAYRVKIGYMTKNDATGVSYVQVTPGYKPVATAPLPGTGGQWKTATASFLRPPAEDNVQVRMVIDNTSVGEGNTLWVRSLEIVELTPPGKK